MEQGANIVGVQFRRAGKIYDFSYNDIDIRIGDHVVVDSDRGPSIAQVASVKYYNTREQRERKLKSILRKASPKETSKNWRLSAQEVDDFTKAQVYKLDLNMRVLKSEIQFGGNKIIVYFSAPGRVDFRELVKELASGLKARVELKQVGARDETKLLGGLGICGREYCCSSFLREFVPVSIRMAKNQNLALNPSKVSGGCGRLLCCLTYENDVYTHLRQILPPRGTKVWLLERSENAMVIKSDLLNQLLLVETENGQEMLVKVSQVKIITKGQDELIDEGASHPELEDDWGQDLDLDALQEHVAESQDKRTEKKNLNHQNNHGSSRESNQERRPNSRDRYKNKKQPNSENNRKPKLPEKK